MSPPGLPDPEVVLYARAYYRALADGRDPADAAAYTARRHPGASPAQVAEAIQLVERGLDVSNALSALGPDAPLADALDGAAPPADTVGVRVDVVWDTSNGQQRLNTLYLEHAWTDSVQDVADSVAEWLASITSEGGPQPGAMWDFSGPTLLPGQI